MRKNILISLMLVSMLMPICISAAKAFDALHLMKQTSGVVLGVPGGAVIGAARGLVKGWWWGTDSTAEALGNKDGIPHRIVGGISGGLLGGAAGGVAGIAMGAYDGVQYGIDNPWSKENFSWAGEKFTDYEPFTW